ncbi:hypothetical protein H4582DRAFT_1823289, partial [Lactarius indigo]
MEPSQRSGAAGDSLDDPGFDDNLGSGLHGTLREASPEAPPLPNPPDHSGSVEDLWDVGLIRLEDLKLAADFITVLRSASLDDPISGMSSEALDRLRSPSRNQPASLINEDSRLAIDLYLGNPSDATYEVNRAAFLRRFPNMPLPSYYKTKRLVAELTGIESIVHDMCINSCIAFTGPFSELESCPMCSEVRYDQFRLEASSGTEKIPWQEFHTIPIGPQLQALYRDPESARRAHYLREERSRVLTEID